jgi:hypothetical protein
MQAATKNGHGTKAPLDELLGDRDDFDCPEFFDYKVGLPTTQELREASRFTREEARSLLGMYMSLQEFRKRAENKERAFKQQADLACGETEPLLIGRFRGGLSEMEKSVAKSMRAYATANPLGQWAMSIAGVDHVLAASLLAHIDLTHCCCRQYDHIREANKKAFLAKGKDGGVRTPIPKHKCPGLVTAGAIWKFAGLLDPDQIQWGKGEVRPYNAQLKMLCMGRLGDCFRRLSAFDKSEEQLEETVTAKLKKAPDSKGRTAARLLEEKKTRQQKRTASLQDESYLYVRLYMKRKLEEVEKNESGQLAGEAARWLQRAQEGRWNIAAPMRKTWESGKLPPRGLDLRAIRYAVKIFLSHFHQVGREILGLPVVKPWIIEHGGHSHYIPPPCWPAK